MAWPAEGEGKSRLYEKIMLKRKAPMLPQGCGVDRLIKQSDYAGLQSNDAPPEDV